MRFRSSFVEATRNVSIGDVSYTSETAELVLVSDYSMLSATLAPRYRPPYGLPSATAVTRPMRAHSLNLLTWYSFLAAFASDLT